MKYIRTFIILFAILGLLAGCKTTEENYRNAYQTAVAKQNEGYTAEEIALMRHEEAIPRTVYKGDSIPLRGVYVNTVKLDPPVPAASRYNVVVASFKQRFNATSAMDRLRDGGYPEAFLLIDKDQNFFVAASTTNSLDSAVTTLRQLEKASPVACRSPFPYILRRP